VHPTAVSKKVVIKDKQRSEDKAVPLQAWTGPEGSMGLRLPDFKTFDT